MFWDWARPINTEWKNRYIRYKKMLCEFREPFGPSEIASGDLIMEDDNTELVDTCDVQVLY
jgi:hypothetical protein